MGWDCILEYPDKIAQVPRHCEGSIITVQTNGLQGTQDADISITYNYSELYYLVLDQSLRDYLNAKKAKETIQTLKLLVNKLGTKQYKRNRDSCPRCNFSVNVKTMFDEESRVQDYWCPTMGNAGHIAAILLDWATLHPEAVWRVSG